jgi:hypothetical protein
MRLGEGRDLYPGEADDCKLAGANDAVRVGLARLVSAATIGCEFCRMVMRAACGAALDLSGRGRGSALGRTFVEAFRDALA